MKLANIGVRLMPIAMITAMDAGGLSRWRMKLSVAMMDMVRMLDGERRLYRVGRRR